MIVYHGSSHSFRQLRIKKEFARQSTKDNEGYGIYFSLDRKVAESYGKWLYTLQVSDRYFVDMRTQQACSSYVLRLRQDMLNVFKLRLEDYFNLEMLARYLAGGGVAISGVGQEVVNLLDSTELFYIRHSGKAEAIFRWLRNWKGVPKAYLFTYHIKDCGIIRDLSPEVVKIIDKERL